MRKLLFLLAPLTLAQAEFLTVKMSVDKMDCATCLKSLEMGFKKIKGVEKASINPAYGAEFTLAAGNKVSLEQLRDSIKAVGFTPGEAQVTVKGKPITQDGRWRFEVDGIAKMYNLATRHDHILMSLQAKTTGSITVSAISPVPPDPRTTPSLDVIEIIP